MAEPLVRSLLRVHSRRAVWSSISSSIPSSACAASSSSSVWACQRPWGCSQGRRLHLYRATSLPRRMRAAMVAVDADADAHCRRAPTRRRLHSEQKGDKQQPTGSAPKRPVTQTLPAASAVRDKLLARLTPHENIYNLPNFLTLTRLFAAPATAYLLLHDQHVWALGLFAYAGITDLVDGWLARRWKLQTVAGSVIDPMADKALMIILTATLAVKGAIPVYLATLILGRDASLALAAIYYRYASLPAPKTFMRYWDFSLPSAEVHPTTVSKYNTFLQLMLIGSALALPVVTGAQQPAGPAALVHTIGLSTAQLHAAMQYFQCLVAATTAWSGLSYAYLKDAVTILGSDATLKAKQGRRGRAIIGLTFGTCVLAAAYSAFAIDAPARKLEREVDYDDHGDGG